jgi:signal transduction histidine kinase
LVNRINLRTRIFLILGALVFITVAGGTVMIWYSYQMDALFSNVINADVAALEQVEELEIELVKQKGFVSYFFIDGDNGWLILLHEHRKKFEDRLKQVNEFVCCGTEKDILEKIESEYSEYIQSKDEIIALYKAGEREQGAALHEHVRENFSRILELSDEFRELHKQRIEVSLYKSEAQAKRYRIIAGTAMSAAVILGVLLAFVLTAQILGPIKKLTQETGYLNRVSERPGNEVSELSNRVHGLIMDVGQTRTELEQSHEMLLQSEKMAVMGKLAADVAHSIRNPMTSIKMRLFSLERGLELSDHQKEDFEVVSEEMRRLDNIVRAFLEFSRPPKLKMRRLNISKVLDMTFQLLSHRLERNDVEVERPHRNTLPEIEGDPELLKEVLVNLIVNALDAMPEGGKISVTGEEAVAENIGRSILVRISDTGPGIPKQFLEKIFDPFFSTKEEGTGLGLPIVKRIIEEHGGHIDLRSEEAGGTTFIIALPVKEDDQ